MRIVHRGLKRTTTHHTPDSPPVGGAARNERRLNDNAALLVGIQAGLAALTVGAVADDGGLALAAADAQRGDAAPGVASSHLV